MKNILNVLRVLADNDGDDTAELRVFLTEDDVWVARVQTDDGSYPLFDPATGTRELRAHGATPDAAVAALDALCAGA